MIIEADAASEPDTSAGTLTSAVGAGFGGGGGVGLDFSDLAALLEITNLRRVGGVFIFGALGVLARLLRGADLGAVALRFNIYSQTENCCAGSE